MRYATKLPCVHKKCQQKDDAKTNKINKYASHICIE